MPCAPRMAVRRDDQPGSGCHLRCLHRQMVEEYRNAREAWEIQRDDECVGYKAEERDYQERKPGPTFKKWLLERARSGRDELLEATG